MSLSIIYSSSYLCTNAIFQQIISISYSTNYTSLYRRKYIYLVSLSTIVRMLLYSNPIIVSLKSSSLVIKSIITKLYIIIIPTPICPWARRSLNQLAYIGKTVPGNPSRVKTYIPCFQAFLGQDFIVLRLKGAYPAPCIPPSWPWPASAVLSRIAKVSFPCLRSLPASSWATAKPGGRPRGRFLRTASKPSSASPGAWDPWKVTFRIVGCCCCCCCCFCWTASSKVLGRKKYTSLATPRALTASGH